jgi:hypothetical protein
MTAFMRPPSLAGSTRAQESPHRWVIAGRVDTVDPAWLQPVDTTLYGLWLVETDTGSITDLDSKREVCASRAASSRSCSARIALACPTRG